MSIVKKTVMYVMMFFSFFLLMNNVKALSEDEIAEVLKDKDSNECIYGRYSGNEWKPYIYFRINGYNDVTLYNDPTYGAAFINTMKSHYNFTANDNITIVEGENCKGCQFMIKKTSFDTWIRFTFYANEEIYNEIGNICPEDVQVCNDKEANFWGINTTNRSFYISTGDFDQIDMDAGDERSGFLWFNFASSTNCTHYKEIKYYDGEYYTSLATGVCNSYNVYKNLLQNAKDEVGGCTNNSNFQSAYMKISELCEKYSSSTNYATTSGGSESAKKCMSSCSYLKDDVVEICGYEQVEQLTENCNSIGVKFLGWIMKIIRWVRYIVPILLIILGILDFIKAIASDSDDEIKKSGGRFAKRLVAAALVFIVPLILQFILGMFELPGLDSSNPFCALNN